MSEEEELYLCALRLRQRKEHQNNENYFKWIKTAAELGHPKAQVMVGQFYQFGLNTVTIHLPTAVDWYTKAANQGDVDGYLQLGFMYHDGHGVKENKQIGRNWLDKAIELGDPFAKLILLRNHREHRPIELEMIKKRADEGDVMMKYAYGYCHYHSLGLLEKNYDICVEYYKQACDEGLSSAQIGYGFCFEHGYSVSVDMEEAVKYYERAALQGHLSAQYNMALCYANGDGVAMNLETAIEWYKKAAEAGHVGAQNNLGVAYFHGEGVPTDYSKATYWYMEAAKSDDSDAFHNLGYAHLEGKGVERNVRESAFYFRRAANVGSNESYELLRGHEELKKAIKQIEDEEYWNITKIIWIGYLKNESCIFSKLPREIFKHMLSFLFVHYHRYSLTSTYSSNETSSSNVLNANDVIK